MYYATKYNYGLIQVRPYENVTQIQEAYSNFSIAKIIMPYEAEDLKDAAVQAGKRLDGGRFILMEPQANGLEIPRRYDDVQEKAQKQKKDKKRL